MLTVKLMLKLTLELTLRLARGADAEADARLKLAVQMELLVLPQLALKLEPLSMVVTASWVNPSVRRGSTDCQPPGRSSNWHRVIRRWS